LDTGEGAGLRRDGGRGEAAERAGEGGRGRGRAPCHETIAQLRQRAEQLDERADFAETTVKGLTTSNGALWSQNERLLAIVSEMRRAGFEMPRFDAEPNDQVRRSSRTTPPR
jgi:hypothetical protein